MTDVEAITKSITIGIFTVLVLGVAGRLLYDYFKSGRVQTGDYYMTVKSCEECREKCCVHPLKTVLYEHINQERGNDSKVDNRLKNIEDRMAEAREDSAKIQVEVAGIRSALDKMAGAFSIYVKNSDERDRRTDLGIGGTT